MAERRSRSRIVDLLFPRRRAERRAKSQPPEDSKNVSPAVVSEQLSKSPIAAGGLPSSLAHFRTEVQSKFRQLEVWAKEDRVEKVAKEDAEPRDSLAVSFFGLAEQQEGASPPEEDEEGATVTCLHRL